MSADLSLAFGFLGVVIAAALFAYSIRKLDIRLLAAGAFVAGVAWLAVAFTSSGEWVRRELVILHLLPIDADDGKKVPHAVVHAIETPAVGPSVAYRLPAKIASTDGQGPVLAVAILVEMRLTGSLVDLYRDPAAHTEVVDQALEITAPGYQSWRGTLTHFLPDGWPATPLREQPITVELRPE